MRRNNFDAVRLVAAVSVLFSHAFLIAEGTEANEPFVALTGGQTILGLLGVFVFFAMSGFLVTQSWFADPSPGAFALKRAARIFPALWVHLLIVALLVGPVVSTLPLAEYFSSPGLAAFLRANFLLEVQGLPLPGVAFSSNEAGTVVNGSLWTLRYELIMYVMVLVLGLAGLLRLSTSLALVVVGIVAVVFENALTPWGDLGQWAWLVGFFASGMALWFLRESALLSDWRIAGLALLGLVSITWAGRLIALFPIFGGFLAIFLALRYAPPLRFLSRWGDLSYGIYIWGWPVEQLVMWASGGRLAWWELFLVSLAVAGALALLSWHLVEKHALRMKAWRRGRVLRRPVPALTPVLRRAARGEPVT